MEVKKSKYENLENCPNVYLVFTKELDNDIENKKFDGICSFCKKELFFNKYICCICKNTYLCGECEQYHNHATIKCKKRNFSTFPQIMNYLISKQEKKKITSKIANFIKKPKTTRVRFEVSTSVQNFTIRAKSSIIVILTIENVSKKKDGNNLQTVKDKDKELEEDIADEKFDFKSLDIYLYSDLNANLNFLEQKLPRLNLKEQKDVPVTLVAGNACQSFEITPEFYCTDKNIKLHYNTLKFNVTVNEDYEEEELNCYFWQYPMLLVQPKGVKQDIKIIAKNEDVIQQHPYLILNYLRENNFDTDMAIYLLFKDQKQNNEPEDSVIQKEKNKTLFLSSDRNKIRDTIKFLDEENIS